MSQSGTTWRSIDRSHILIRLWFKYRLRRTSNLDRESRFSGLMLLIIVSYHRNGGYISSLFPVKFNGSFLINGSRIIGAFISPDDSSFPPSTSASFANSFCIRYPLPVYVDYQSETHRLHLSNKNARQLFMLGISLPFLNINFVSHVAHTMY